MDYRDMDTSDYSRSESNMNSLTPITPVEREAKGSMESRLRSLGARIDELMVRAEAAKARAGEKAAVLRDKQQGAMTRFNEMKSHSGEAWDEFKPGLDRAWEDLKKAWEEVRTASNRAASKLH
jgi:hypothetical protein